MLCCSGMDVMSLAPDAFALVRDLLPSSPALFLFTQEGDVRARHHEDCPDHVHRLCIEGGELFDRPGEPTFRSLYCDPGQPKVGPLLNPPDGYFRSNTYQLLVRGWGHHHTLDARLEADGRTFGSLCLFREAGGGFGSEEIHDFRRVVGYLEHALGARRPVWDEAGRVVEAEAMAIVDLRGDLLFASPRARELIDQLSLIRSHWPDRRRLPPLCRQLVDMLRDDGGYPLRMPVLSVPVPGGVLEMRAQWLDVPGDKDVDVGELPVQEPLIGISFQWSVPVALRVWRNLEGVKLSPAQMEVAYWMATGGGREAARTRMSISDAVLRDCVKAIYEKLECSSQEGLAARLRGPVMPGDSALERRRVH